MHACMASGLKRRFDDDDDDLSHITLRAMSKYRFGDDVNDLDNVGNDWIN